MRSIRAQLEAELVAYDAGTGHQIAVLTVPSLQGESIEDFAVRVFEVWGIGNAETDTGVLLLIAKEDREVRIEVGYGAEAYVTDGRADRIIREDIAPAFKEERYDAGVAAAVGSLRGYLGGEVASIAGEGDTGSSEGWMNFFIFLIFVVFEFMVEFLGRSKSVWQGGVAGGVFGAGVWLFLGLAGLGVLAGLALFFGFLGLIFDLLVSRHYASRVARGLNPWWHRSGGSGGGGGGGFGGFGGGSSG
ncbi:MAG: TPM domain-containing protein, partial [Patescibacteria group bacterium]